MNRRFLRALLLLAVLAAAYGASGRAASDIRVAMPILPGLSQPDASGNPDGRFVDLIRALEGASGGQRFSISLYPFIRAKASVGVLADILFPLAWAEPMPLATDAYRYSAATVYKPVFFLYCRPDLVLTPEEARSGRYHIETDRAHADVFPFADPVGDSPSGSLLKVAHGRIDAYLFAAASADAALRVLIHAGELREGEIVDVRYGVFQAKFLLPPGPRGQELDAMISAGMDNLTRSGRLKEILGPVVEYYERR
jgi:ABC-type amino acid transport substrate-binding protein